MKQLTEKDVNKRFAKFPVKFKSYYKYSFTFQFESSELLIKCSFGGNHDDIYRYTLEADKEQPFGEVNDWNWVAVYISGEKVFENEYDW